VHGAGGPTDGLYSISFQDASRTKSLAVVRTLLSNFVEDTLGSKRSGQEAAQKFLKEQIADYENRLSQAEERLAEFKKQNVGKMPDQRGDYFGRLQAEETALEQSRNELSIAEAKRDELQRQLSGEDPFVFGFDNELNAANVPGQAGDLTARIQELEKREQDLLLRYTEKHPEVISVRKTLEELKAQQAAELDRMRRGQGTGSLAASTKANPVYQSMKLQLNNAEVQIAELRRTVAQRSTNVASLRKLVDTVPQVEADIARLNRDYEVTRAQYLALVQRLETAKMSENADQTGTIRFQVIDPPAVPLRPVAPMRSLLFSGVLILALVAGLGTAALLNLARPVFHNARGLAEDLGLPVIGSVTRMWSAQFRSVRQRDLLGFCGGVACLLVAFGVVSAFGERAIQALFGTGG
jgi:polysaccharide chain length determinant protein (PEP-CTERM system associated)